MHIARSAKSINAAGGSCTCHLTEESGVRLDSFVPNPQEDKSTTFKKKQRRAVKEGVEKVRKQDNAMWAALTGVATTKCLLAVTLCAAVFQNAIGHNTTFLDPGPKAVNCNDAGIAKLEKIVEDQKIHR